MANETGFSILKYYGPTPVLAVCVKCQLKFFTPAQMMKDWDAAEEYLWKKYKSHRCTAASSIWDINEFPPIES